MTEELRVTILRLMDMKIPWQIFVLKTNQSLKGT